MCDARLHSHILFVREWVSQVSSPIAHLRAKALDSQSGISSSKISGCGARQLGCSGEDDLAMDQIEELLSEVRAKLLSCAPGADAVEGTSPTSKLAEALRVQEGVAHTDLSAVLSAEPQTDTPIGSSAAQLSRCAHSCTELEGMCVSESETAVSRNQQTQMQPCNSSPALVSNPSCNKLMSVTTGVQTEKSIPSLNLRSLRKHPKEWTWPRSGQALTPVRQTADVKQEQHPSLLGRRFESFQEQHPRLLGRRFEPAKRANSVASKQFIGEKYRGKS
mmetsp:Transcript_63880/g.121009  ORF Transcript_63880/g.121009 Transcript_63880/m.121009 type:complete len:276 (-) Transcript_63880:76-903(-)